MKKSFSVLAILMAASIIEARAQSAAPSVDAPSLPSMQVAQTTLDAKAEARRAPTDSEALALAALEGLLAQPAERALPLVKKVLAGSQSVLVKKRALFVLSQIEQPEAQTILLQVAREAESPLRMEAIRTIGVSGNDTSVAALKEIYANGDDKIKKQVLQSWLIAGRKAEVYQVAAAAKSESEAAHAIRTLSVMGASDELRKLNETRKDSKSLVQAFAVAGDLPSLRKIAESPGEMARRVDAVRSIGIIGKDEARTALREIYTNSSQAQLKDAALQGLLIAGDQQGVLTLYRTAKTTDEKRTLLRTLSIMGGDAAIAAIDAALEGKK